MQMEALGARAPDKSDVAKVGGHEGDGLTHVNIAFDRLAVASSSRSRAQAGKASAQAARLKR